MKFEDIKIATAFGQVIKEEREKAGLSRVELAKIAGLTRHTILKYENGENLPSLGIVFALSRSLKMGTGQFVDLVEEKV